jgi:hypothetical protein
MNKGVSLLSYAFGHEGNLPAKIVTILHRDVHSLARFRTVGMYGIPCEEYTFVSIKVGAQPLPNLVTSVLVKRNCSAQQ